MTENKDWKALVVDQFIEREELFNEPGEPGLIADCVHTDFDSKYLGYLKHHIRELEKLVVKCCSFWMFNDILFKV